MLALDDAELIQITRRRRPSAQARVLREAGIPYRMIAGRPVIARARLCLRCGVPFKERGVGCSYMGVDYGRHLWPKNEGLNND